MSQLKETAFDLFIDEGAIGEISGLFDSHGHAEMVLGQLRESVAKLVIFVGYGIRAGKRPSHWLFFLVLCVKMRGFLFTFVLLNCRRICGKFGVILNL